MKVNAAQAVVVNLPIDPPIEISGSSSIRSADCVLTFLDTDAGLTGEGLVFTFNENRLDAIRETVEHVGALALGLDLHGEEPLHHRVQQDVHLHRPAEVSIIGAAAIDMALWDLRGKAAGCNVAQLIGADRPSVPTYASGALWRHCSIDELQADAAALVARGFRAVKTRVGPGDPRETVTRVEAIREAIGPDVALMVDAYQQLSVDEAIHLGRRLEPLNPAWLEEPVPCHDHDGEAKIRRALAIPVASGESLYGRRGIRALLQAGAVDVAMPDLQRMGGPTELLAVGDLCEAYQTPCSPHLFTEMSLPLAAGLPTCCYVEYMPWFEAIYRERIELDVEGNCIVPDRPGWGFTFDPEQVRRYSVA